MFIMSSLTLLLRNKSKDGTLRFPDSNLETRNSPSSPKNMRAQHDKTSTNEDPGFKFAASWRDSKIPRGVQRVSTAPWDAADSACKFRQATSTDCGGSSATVIQADVCPGAGSATADPAKSAMPDTSESNGGIGRKLMHVHICTGPREKGGSKHMGWTWIDKNSLDLELTALASFYIRFTLIKNATLGGRFFLTQMYI